MSKFPSANKSLGQHFLRDQKTIDMITTDFAGSAKAIIEVGPGPGVLTTSLAEHALPLHLIEKDSRFIEDLEKLTPHVNNEDALKFDWDGLFSKIQSEEIWLVSNLPYNVGTPLFLKFLQLPAIKYMTLMFQKEVGEKTVIQNKRNTMNGLQVLTSLFFESKVLRKVAPGCFSPPPKVDSIVISYQRKEQPLIPLGSFSQADGFCRILFSNRRKKLSTVLKQHPRWHEVSPTLNKEILELRSEALSLEQVYDLMRNFLRL